MLQGHPPACGPLPACMCIGASPNLILDPDHIVGERSTNTAGRLAQETENIPGLLSRREEGPCLAYRTWRFVAVGRRRWVLGFAVCRLELGGKSRACASLWTRGVFRALNRVLPEIGLGAAPGIPRWFYRSGRSVVPRLPLIRLVGISRLGPLLGGWNWNLGTSLLQAWEPVSMYRLETVEEYGRVATRRWRR
jgi:hypothetical protein